MEKQKLQFSSLVSREERHYCAYLFAWFLMDKRNVKTYFENHTNLETIFPDFDKIDFQNCEVYYEYTAIRELIYHVRHVNRDSEAAEKIKLDSEKQIFCNTTGDIQKKKADLAFFFPKNKTLILTEAKFEMAYDENQFGQTKRYGEYLQKEFSDDILEVNITLLGTEYYNQKYSNLSAISWEKVTEIIDNELIRNEIIKGLDYQQAIHKKAMKNWKLTTSSPKKISKNLRE